MSLRQLVEGDCGGVNPLMQLGGQFTRDVAHKDEGFARAQFERGMRPDEQMVNDFLGQVAAPPQSFQMQTLLQEMREIEQHQHAAAGPTQAARVIDEVSSGQWAKQFATQAPPRIMNMQPQQQQIQHVNEFFDEPGTSAAMMPHMLAICPAAPMGFVPQHFGPMQQQTDAFFDEVEGAVGGVSTELPQSLQGENWLNDFEANKDNAEQAATNYNEKFWQRLQDEWQKLSEAPDHPWLNEFDETYDPYKEYNFIEENPMNEMENAFEKGKEYLAKGDLPSAVLCFEVAAKKDPKNAEIWELLGITQAENEMDPQSIAALKRSLELRPDNQRVLMALAVCYTNENLPSHALKMLTTWLEVSPKYKQLVENFKKPEPGQSEAGALASSLIRGNRLSEVQNLFLDAVRLNPQEFDPDVQEALGVLYNLSSEFDKAVDCFQAALHVNPQNAKVWNRLGATLANGSRSVEAVEAYQQALALEPGFIRVRYNVGVCCMNLKAYPQAVEHLLTALNMQANSAALKDLPPGVGGGQQQMSESIWSSLKMVISLMGRSDLIGAVTDRNLKVLNDAFLS